MDGGDAIGAMGANNGQMRHADLFDGRLLDETHAHHTPLIAGEVRAHLVQEAAVDLVDDLEMPGEDQFKEPHRPLFQRFGQQRVIGIGQRPRGQLPGLVPAKPGLIQQDAHQLGDGHAPDGYR